MEKSEQKKPQELERWIDFNGAAQQKPVLHANQMMIQTHAEEVFLTFFQIAPPVTFGSPEDRRRQLQESEKIVPECVARLNMTPDFLEKVLKAIVIHIAKQETEKKESDKKDDDDGNQDEGEMAG